jgi:hypothetical protein
MIRSVLGPAGIQKYVCDLHIAGIVNFLAALCCTVFTSKYSYQLDVVSAILSAAVLTDGLQFWCMVFGMQGFCCS